MACASIDLLPLFTIMGCLLLCESKTVARNCLRRHWLRRLVHYVQGQTTEKGVREYFYFIDHQGQLFLDNARLKNFTSCFKEKDFLAFFFRRLKLNTTDRYREFPYLSVCAQELNYVRCDDRPVVFTHVLPGENSEVLAHNWAGDRLTLSFQPEKLCMLPVTGRVYHPAPDKFGGVGLVRSALAIEFSKNFSFENGEASPPTKFRWKDVEYQLTNELFEIMISRTVR